MQETTVNYKKNLLKKLIAIRSIYTIHYFKYKKNFRFKGEKHNFWEVVYIDSGKATVVANEKEFSLNQGMCFLHKPNEPHTIYTTDMFANSVIITFDCKNKELFSLCGKILTLSDEQKILLNKIITETKYSFNDNLSDIYLSKMNKKTDAPFGCDQIITNCIELLLISLIRNQHYVIEEKEGIKSVNYSTNVKSIIEILNKKLDKSDKVNLEEIACSLGYSKSFLKMQFKKETGYSIIQFFINMKIEKAKELLSQQKYSISEISDLLGFNSLYYFSRQFKQETSMSPSQYISSIKSDETL